MASIENKLSNELRSRLGGTYIQLTNGFVHYEFAGPEDGEVIVLIHGATFPMFGWDDVFKRLVDSGFRVLRYDLYGRGFSDRPDLTYNEDPWDNQLLELLQKLNIKRKVNLVGLSVGGGVASIFSSRHTELVSKLVMIAPIGIPVNLPFAAKLSSYPLLGDFIMKLVGEKVAYERYVDTYIEPQKFESFHKRFKTQLEIYGFTKSLLSMIRNYPLHNLKSVFTKIEKDKIPSMLIWGDMDSANPYENHKEIQKLMPSIRFESVKGTGHSIHVEQSQVVTEHILAHLK